MAEAARRLVVGRLRKPHGLKGECAVFPLTDSPDEVFQPGRRLWMVDLAGNDVGEALTIERGRGHHREWLLKFEGIDSRTALEALPAFRGVLVAADAADLAPPADDEIYTHELVGFSVRTPDGTALGVVSELYELPSGLTLEVQGPKREFLLPYRQEFVHEVNRDQRALTVTVPEGLVE